MPAVDYVKDGALLATGFLPGAMAALQLGATSLTTVIEKASESIVEAEIKRQLYDQKHLRSNPPPYLVAIDHECGLLETKLIQMIDDQGEVKKRVIMIEVEDKIKKQSTAILFEVGQMIKAASKATMAEMFEALKAGEYQALERRIGAIELELRGGAGKSSATDIRGGGLIKAWVNLNRRVQMLETTAPNPQEDGSKLLALERRTTTLERLAAESPNTKILDPINEAMDGFKKTLLLMQGRITALEKPPPNQQAKGLKLTGRCCHHCGELGGLKNDVKYILKRMTSKRYGDMNLHKVYRFAEYASGTKFKEIDNILRELVRMVDPTAGGEQPRVGSCGCDHKAIAEMTAELGGYRKRIADIEKQCKEMTEMWNFCNQAGPKITKIEGRLEKIDAKLEGSGEATQAVVDEAAKKYKAVVDGDINGVKETMENDKAALRQEMEEFKETMTKQAEEAATANKKKVERLEAAYEKLSGEHAELKQQVENQRQNMPALVQEAVKEAMKETTAALAQQINDLEKSTKEQAEAAAAKDRETEGLKANHEKLSSENAELKQRLEGQDERMNALVKEAVEEALEGPRAAVGQKINGLEESIKKQGEATAGLNQEIDELRSDNEDDRGDQEKLKQRLEAQEEKLKAQEQKMVAQDQRLKEQPEATDAKNEEIDGLRANYQQLLGQQEELKQKLSAQGEKLKVQDEMLEAQEQKIKMQGEVAAGLNKEMDLLRKDIEDPSTNQDGLKQKFEAQEEKLDAQDQIIKEQGEKIEAQENKLNAQDEKLEAQDQKLGEQGGMVKAQDQKLEQAQDQIKKQGEQIEAHAARFEAVNAEQGVQNEEIQSLTARVERLEQNGGAQNLPSPSQQEPPEPPQAPPAPPAPPASPANGPYTPSPSLPHQGSQGDGDDQGNGDNQGDGDKHGNGDNQDSPMDVEDVDAGGAEDSNEPSPVDDGGAEMEAPGNNGQPAAQHSPIFSPQPPTQPEAPAGAPPQPIFSNVDAPSASDPNINWNAQIGNFYFGMPNDQGAQPTAPEHNMPPVNPAPVSPWTSEPVADVPSPAGGGSSSSGQPNGASGSNAPAPPPAMFGNDVPPSPSVGFPSPSPSAGDSMSPTRQESELTPGALPAGTHPLTFEDGTAFEFKDMFFPNGQLKPIAKPGQQVNDHGYPMAPLRSKKSSSTPTPASDPVAVPGDQPRRNLNATVEDYVDEDQDAQSGKPAAVQTRVYNHHSPSQAWADLNNLNDNAPALAPAQPSSSAAVAEADLQRPQQPVKQVPQRTKFSRFFYETWKACAMHASKDFPKLPDRELGDMAHQQQENRSWQAELKRVNNAHGGTDKLMRGILLDPHADGYSKRDMSRLMGQWLLQVFLTAMKKIDDSNPDALTKFVGRLLHKLEDQLVPEAADVV